MDGYLTNRDHRDETTYYKPLPARGGNIPPAPRAAVGLGAPVPGELDFTTLAVLSDAVHVFAAAGWLGGLLVMIAVGVPAAVRSGEGARAVAVFLITAVLVAMPTPRDGSGVEPDSPADALAADEATVADEMLATVLALALPTAAPAAEPESHRTALVVGIGKAAPDSAAVAAVIQRFHAALAAGDSAAVHDLLAPDATILENGVMETRDEYLAGHLHSDIAFARAVPRESGPVRVVVQEDAAWATSLSTARGEFRGRQVNSASVELMVLRRTPAGWRIAAIHWSSRALRS